MNRFFELSNPVYRVPCGTCKAESGQRCRTTIRIAGAGYAPDMEMTGVHKERFETLENWKKVA